MNVGQTLEEQLQEFEQRMKEIFHQTPQIEWLLSLPGVGFIRSGGWRLQGKGFSATDSPLPLLDSAPRLRYIRLMQIMENELVNEILSPRFGITNAIAGAVTRIERARGFLEAAQLSEDWIANMQDRALVLEAHYTTHIEGTQLTLEQSEELLAGQDISEVRPQDARDLLNYRDAFNLVAGYLNSGYPVTEGFIREIHRHLVRGDPEAGPGEYRKTQNYIVNSWTQEIVYTPPPAQDVPPMMAVLVSWLNEETKISPILVAGIAQFQLVHIHPFLNGNGRTARLLSTLCLYRMGYDFKRLFTISEYYDRDREAYYKALQSVRESDMDLTKWLEYFTEGLATQMREVRERGEGVIRHDVILSRARREGLKERTLAVLAFLLDQGKGTVKDCELALNKNRRTLQRDLKLLVDKGFVREVGTSPTDPTKYYEPVL